MTLTLFCSQSFTWIHSQTPSNKILCILTHIFPIFWWFKRIISRHNSLHLFYIGISIKWCISAKQEIGDYSQGPYVNRFTMSRLFEDFRSHVAWCAACCGEYVE